MNGIPITFNEGLPSYAVIGGRGGNTKTGISAVILDVDGRNEAQKEEDSYEKRALLYKNLLNSAFDSVVSLEFINSAYQTNCDFDKLSAEFPFVSFILLNDNINLGRQINLAAAETAKAKRFVVLRRGFSPSLFSAKTEALSKEQKALCAVPQILLEGQEAPSVVVSPALSKHGGLLIKNSAHRGGARTLFPFGGMGLYTKELFARLGGFDGGIEDEYWQLLDFGLRSYAWGEQIICSTTLKFMTKQVLPSKKIVFDESYRRFYLKNLSPVFHLDAAHLPLRRFPPFLAKSGIFLADAWVEFKEARSWVGKNAYRWKLGARNIIENWE